MRLGKTMRGLAPRRLRQTLRALAAKDEPPIWEGVHESFLEVPAGGEGHDGDEWIQATMLETERLIAASGTTATIPEEVSEERSLLPLLAAIVSEQNGGPVRILDFGGGAGADYVRVLASAPGIAVSYDVVETEGVCEAARALFPGDDRIRFLPALTEDIPRPDIVHLCSSLQYVEDPAGLLARLCRLGARYILLVKLAAGDVRTFATAQRNVWGSSIPYWFLNVSELIDRMADQGYDLRFKGVMARIYEQGALPPERRVPRMGNLLFARRREGEPRPSAGSSSSSASGVPRDRSRT